MKIVPAASASPIEQLMAALDAHIAANLRIFGGLDLRSQQSLSQQQWGE